MAELAHGAAVLAARPTAVVAASDVMAVGVTRAAAAAGLRPQDVSVVGFDDLPLAVLVQPGLTTVRQDPERVGAAAADCLIARMRDGAAGRRTVVPVDLIVRGSTARREPSESTA